MCPQRHKAIYKRQVGWCHPLLLHLLTAPCKITISSFCSYLQTISGLCPIHHFQHHHVGYVLITTPQNEGKSLQAAFPDSRVKSSLSALPCPKGLNCSPCCWLRFFWNPNLLVSPSCLKSIKSSPPHGPFMKSKLLKHPSFWLEHVLQLLPLLLPPFLVAWVIQLPRKPPATSSLPAPVMACPQLSSPWKTPSHSSRSNWDVTSSVKPALIPTTLPQGKGTTLFFVLWKLFAPSLSY